MKDSTQDLGAAMKAAEELQMFDDGHYKLAAERLMGRASFTVDNLTLEKARVLLHASIEEKI